MTEPDRNVKPTRNDATLWILVGLMALIVVGGLVYGLSYPSIYVSNPPQTVGSAAAHMRSGHPL
jgi:uncharacterized membrane protein